MREKSIVVLMVAALMLGACGKSESGKKEEKRAVEQVQQGTTVDLKEETAA